MLGLRGKALNLAIAITAGTGFLLFGYDQGVMSALISLPRFYNVFPETHDPNIQGITIAIYEIGCMFGAMSLLKTGDMLGRRRAIMVGATIILIGAILQCTSYSLAQMIVARIVTGVGNGMNTGTIPTWQSECAKAHDRGHLVMIEGALLTAGIAISYWVDFGFFFVNTNDAQWRVPIAIQCIFAVFLFVGSYFLVESPRWLIKKGRVEEGRKVLSQLYDTEVDDVCINQLIEEIEASLEATPGKLEMRELFSGGRTQHFRRLALGFVSQMFQQLSGINLVLYYATILFEQSIGMSKEMSRLLAACNGTEMFLASLVAIWLIESMGRRKLMILGAIGMSSSMIVLAVTTDKRMPKGASILAAVMLFFYNSFFALGWMGMSWLYPSEINPLRIRTQANAISTVSNWMFNFLVVMVTPVGLASIGNRYYIVWAVFCALFVPCVYFFFPETSGKSLEEMDFVFAGAYDEGVSPVTYSRKFGQAKAALAKGDMEAGKMATVENITKVLAEDKRDGSSKNSVKEDQGKRSEDNIPPAEKQPPCRDV